MDWLKKPRNLAPKDANGRNKFLISISQYLGLLPRNGNFRLSKWWTVYALLIRFWIASATLFFIFGIISYWENGHYVKMKIGLTTFAEIAAFITPTLHVITTIRNSGFWKRLWFFSIETPTVHKHFVSNISLFAGIINAVILKIFDLYHYQTPSTSILVLHLISSCLSECAILVIIIQFCVIVNEIKLQVTMKNKKLIKNRSPTILILRQSMEYHIKYLRLVKEVNYIYSWQILGSCITLSIKFLSYLYDTLTDLMEFGMNLRLVVVRVSAAVNFLMLIFFLVKTCQDFSHAADNLNFNIFETLRKIQFSTAIPEIQTYVLMKNKMQFTAAGFFALDYPVITSITTLATTFLVIVLQFSMGKPLTASFNSTWTDL